MLCVLSQVKPSNADVCEDNPGENIFDYNYNDSLFERLEFEDISS